MEERRYFFGLVKAALIHEVCCVERCSGIVTVCTCTIWMNNIFPVHILYHPKIQKYFPSLTNQPHGDAYNTPNFKAHLLVGGGGDVQKAKLPRNLHKAHRNSSICIWWLQQCRSPHTRSCCFVSSFLMSSVATFPCKHLNFWIISSKTIQHSLLSELLFLYRYWDTHSQLAKLLVYAATLVIL